MRRPFGHRERVLAGLSAPTTHLVPAEVGPDMIDAIEGLEQVPREHDVLHELRHPPITDHAAVGGREREVLEHRLAAERAAGVHPELDVADQVLEASAPRGACGFSYTKSASGRCPNASWMNTPASSGSRITGYVPPFTIGASSSCTARSATSRNPAALSCTEFQPRRNPIDSSPFSMVPSRRATAVPESVTSGRSSCSRVPCEFTYQYSLTSSRYTARVTTIRSLTPSMTPLYASSSRFFSAMGTPRTSPSRSRRASA